MFTNIRCLGKLNTALAVACVTLVLSGGQRHPAMHYDRYWNDYTQSFVTKIFLKSKTRPQVSTTMDQARDIIRRTWEVSGGIHQIIYLVGWQYDGHDSKFPSWDQVGDQCKSSWSDDPLTSLRMLMREVREKYNCDLSLHLNMTDAHEDSPHWQYYVDNKLLCYDKNGKSPVVGGAYKWHSISLAKEWRAGVSQKRIDALLAMIPELKDSRSVHIDAFYAHASPLDGLTIEDDKNAIKAITDYWHKRGIDVTNEFLTSLDMIGYFPMVYHFNLDECLRLRYPVEVLAPGDDVWNVRKERDYYGSRKSIHGPVHTSPASGCLYEEAWGRGCFCDMGAGHLGRGALLGPLFRNTFLCTWYNRHPLKRHVVTATDYTVEREGGVVANVRMSDRRLTVTENGRTVVDGGDYFLDEAWGGGVILAYSTNGCNRDFALPQGWDGSTALAGTSFPSGKQVTLPVSGKKMHLTLARNESLVLRRP